jgi:hypothetical protein
LELPTLLSAPSPPLVGPSLAERGVPTERIVAVFDHAVGREVTGILEPYLALL